MKRQTCASICVLAAAGCSTAPARLELPSPRPVVERFVQVQIAEEGNAVRRVPLEVYVQGTIISEFAPPSGDERVVRRMLEVQAIVGRTYALANLKRHAAGGYDLCSTSHCQLYEPSRLKTSRWAPAGRAAAEATADVVLWHGQSPALPLFHADCGGHTSTAVHVWRGTPRAYLVAAPDDDIEDLAHMRWRHEIAAADLVRALNGDARTRVGAQLHAINVVDRDPSGRAQTLALHGQHERLVAGDALRAILTRAFGIRSIRSTLFEVRRESGTFVFEGRGFGHGVGLCQAGALARIKSGASPAAVLKRYFPHTVIRSLRAAP